MKNSSITNQVKRTTVFSGIKRLLLIMIMFLSSQLFAQNNIEITGQIKGEQDNRNLMYCSVAVLNKTDSLITGGITNDRGYFTIPIKRGSYKLAYSYMGFVADTVDIGYVTGDKFLGTFKLKKDLQSIDEVEITASSRETTIDKEMQIITDKMRSGTSDAKEVLEKIPGLSYDRYNNTISVDNSSNVVFLVDGVEKNQEYIKNLSPKRLKKVEVIRNPGGRYGLQGYSAIINIILRKDFIGQEFFINDQMLVDPDTKNSAYFFPMSNINLTYNYSFGKFNVYAGYNNFIQKFALETSTKTDYVSGKSIHEYSPYNDANMLFHNKQSGLTFGADYFLNPKNTISFESNTSFFPKAKQTREQNIKTDVFNYDELIDSYQYINLTNQETKSSYNNLFYVGRFSDKDRLDASFSYNYYHEKHKSTRNYDDLSQHVEQGTNEKNYTKFNIEYNHDFGSKLSAQVGYGNIWKKLNNSFLVYEQETSYDTSMTFKQTETRHNLYAYGSYKLNKKWGFKVGLAAEYSNPVTAKQNHKYLIYQPYLDVKYDINKLFSLKLMYRSDADYPTISQTNPFASQIDPNTISTGNPELKPAVTQKISLKLIAMQGLFSIEPYYYFSNNYISQTGILRPDGVFEYTYNNIGHFEDKGVQANFTIPIGKLFIWQNSLRIYNSKITYNGNVNSINDWKANSQLIFRGLKNNGVIVLNYRRDMSKNITAMGYARNFNDYWLLIVQQPFFKNRLTAMVGYMLPVDWGVNYTQDNYVKANGYEKYTYTDISVLKNMFIVKLSFRFSKGKVKKVDKQIETETEKSSGGIF